MGLPHHSKAITGMDDVTLVPTPVTISRWAGKGKEEWTEDQLKADLVKQPIPCDVVTMIASDVYGGPFLLVGRLKRAVIEPRPPGGESPWQLIVGLMPPRKRTPDVFRRDFPSDAVLLMWGQHAIALDGLPPLTSRLRWHCANFGPAWREVARRCYAIAGSGVWIDTTEAAVKHQEQRMAPTNAITA